MKTFIVENQQDFLDYSIELINSLKKREDTDYVMKFKSGQYYFSDKMFNFNNLNNSEKDEKINLEFSRADDAVEGSVKMAAGGYEVEDGGEVLFDFPNHAFLTMKKKKYSCLKKLLKSSKSTSAPNYSSMWDYKFYDSKGLINVIDEEKKICELTYDGKLSKILNKDYFDDSSIPSVLYINVTQWFTSNYYKVLSVDFEKNTIRFACSDLTLKDENKKTWSINNDFNYSQKFYPKFRLSCSKDDSIVQVINSKKDSNKNEENGFNFLASGQLKLPKNVERVHVCKYSNFLTVKNCDCFNSISIKGIEFNGNGVEKFENNIEAVFNLNNVKLGSFAVENCAFKNIYTNVVYTSNVMGCTWITLNKFEDCFKHGVLALSRNLDGFSTEISTNISGNEFINCGLYNTNTFCIRCDCQNYKIYNNTFKNYGYGGIAVGTWWKTLPNPKVLHQGSVYDNVLKNDKKYRFPLMDSGAIYTYTQNESAQIYQNTIENYEGRHSNRGIFCDDGAFNIILSYNTIKNTPNSYSIDSRRVKSAESVMNRLANVGNSFHDNTFDSTIRFEGNEKFKPTGYNNDYYKELCFMYKNHRSKKAKTDKDVIKNVYDENQNLIK